MAPDPLEERDAARDGESLPDLPTSLIPRWLAAVVLLALLASGVLSAWLILAGGPPSPPPPAVTAP